MASELLPSHLSDEALAPSRGVPAWLTSFGLHLVIIVLLAVFLVQNPKGAGEGSDRKGGIVLVDINQQKTQYLTEDDFNTDAIVADSSLPASQATPQSPPNESVTPEQLFEFNNPTGVGQIVGNTPGADQLLTDGGKGRAPGGHVTAEVFGIKGTGSRFVYVFDRSASMNDFGGTPLLAAKKQLSLSLDSLDSVHQFQIIFYNDEISLVQPDATRDPKMMFGSDLSKEQANDFIKSIRGAGGTNHLKAIRKALSLGPDVIFFLTDAEGGFTSQELADIQRWNRSAATINAIEFGVGSRDTRDKTVELMAHQNRGGYTYLDLSKLGR
jgi:hypothetical protein